ncbi:hypothetical protein [Legionella sp. CNM-4043-24]|uniref:hypothetical protein n=1 Tax=Legionella sp. CNM-4043-24 TaxID=3421646 RepID=UPI00403ABF8F
MSASMKFMGTLFNKTVDKLSENMSLLNPNLDNVPNQTVVGVYLRKSRKSWNPSSLTNPDSVVVILEKCLAKGDVGFQFYNTTGYSGRGEAEIDSFVQINDSSQAKDMAIRFVEKQSTDVQMFFQIPSDKQDGLMEDVMALAGKHAKGEQMLNAVKGIFIKAGFDQKEGFAEEAGCVIM